MSGAITQFKDVPGQEPFLFKGAIAIDFEYVSKPALLISQQKIYRIPTIITKTSTSYVMVQNLGQAFCVPVNKQSFLKGMHKI